MANAPINPRFSRASPTFPPKISPKPQIATIGTTSPGMTSAISTVRNLLYIGK